MACGGMFFALMTETPPIMKACWRLGLTSLLQLPGFVYDYRKADTALRKRWWKNLPYLAVNGCVFAVHFASWSSAVEYTSLAHAFLIGMSFVHMLVYDRICHMQERRLQ